MSKQSNTLDSYFSSRREPAEKTESETQVVADESPIREPEKRRVLGILGGHKRSDYAEFQKTVVKQMIEKMSGLLPELVILNDEGKDTSGMIYMWCEQNDIPCRYVRADWIANGKRAGIIRDNMILKEANAFLLFEGPKSQYIPKIAARLQKKKVPCLSIPC